MVESRPARRAGQSRCLLPGRSGKCVRRLFTKGWRGNGKAGPGTLPGKLVQSAHRENDPVTGSGLAGLDVPQGSRQRRLGAPTEKDVSTVDFLTARGLIKSE